MAATISFYEGRNHGMMESPIHARLGGSPTTPSSSYGLSNVWSAHTFRCGTYDPDFGAFTVGADSSAFFPWDGTAAITSAPSETGTCYRRWDVVITSTPDPGTLTGTLVTTNSQEFGQGSQASSGSYSGDVTHWVSDYNDASPALVSQSSDATSLTWAWSGTYLDEEEVEQEWTQTAVMTISEEYTNEDFLSDAVALYNIAKAGYNPSVPSGNIHFYDENGDPITGLTAPGWFIFITIPVGDIPTHTIGASQHAVGTWYDPSVYAVGYPGVAIVAGVGVISNIAAPARYGRESSYDGTRGDVTSELYPGGSYEILIEPSAGDLTNVTSGVFRIQSWSLASLYTQPVPDYPVPS